MLGLNPQPIYFYCSRGAAELERSHPDAILASILRQLVDIRSSESLPRPIVEKFKKRGESFDSKGPTLEESLRIIISLKECNETTIIVVDALDECATETRQTLLEAFEKIVERSSGLVKIFVSSRDDQDIVCSLRDHPQLEISSEKNTDDIESFVEIETRALVRKGRLLRNSGAKEEMKGLIVNQICEGADGM